MIFEEVPLGTSGKFPWDPGEVLLGFSGGSLRILGEAPLQPSRRCLLDFDFANEDAFAQQEVEIDCDYSILEFYPTKKSKKPEHSYGLNQTGAGMVMAYS